LPFGTIKDLDIRYYANPDKMKTNVPLKALSCLFMILSSNAFSENAPGNPVFVIDQPKEATSCFIQLNDGSIKNYATLKLVTGVFKTPHLLANDSIVITADQIRCYQNKEHYAVSQKQFTDKKPSLVAVAALPGFAVRIAKGKLNVYSLKYYNGHNVSEKFYLQSGDDAPIVAYTQELMSEMVKDNSEAYTFFNDKNKVPAFAKKLLITAEIYNSGKDISKN
jgi:hypothetical protein